MNLLNELSKYNNIDTKNIILTNGADEALKLLIDTYSDDYTEIFIQSPTYRQYERFALLNNATIHKIDNIRSLDILINKSARTIIIICTPNNPTGKEITASEIQPFVDKYSNSLFIIDRTYSDYTKLINNSDDIMQRFSNLNNVFIVKSFSKAFGLAGLRLGYIISNGENIKILNAIFNFKNIPNIVKTVGFHIMKNLEYYKLKAKTTINLKDNFVKFLRDRNQIFIDTQCNFILLRLSPHTNLVRFINYLYSQNILIRDISNNVPDHVRITIGNANYMEVLKNKIDYYLKNLNNDIWSFLDKYNIQVWCISLEERNDRYTYVCNEFKKVGLYDRVNFHRPPRNPRSGREGCLISHLTCMKEANKNFKHALVFEDDVKFTDDWQNPIEEIKIFLENDNTWDIFRFGCVLAYFEHKSTYSEKIWKAKSYNNHAIIYNKSLMQNILEKGLEKTTVHIDGYLHDNAKINDYSLINPICYQKAGLSSDNNWFSCKFLQNMMENKYIFERLQYINNRQVWMMRFLPIKIQDKINIWTFFSYFDKK